MLLRPMGLKPRPSAGALPLTPAQFLKQWAVLRRDEFVRYSSDEVKIAGFPAASARFLTSAGLPRSAAPCLDFRRPEQGAFPTIGQVYSGVTWVPARYRIVGSTGNGDPVCIDLDRAGEVVFLDHDFHWRRVYINCSIAALATCLVLFTRALERAREMGVELADPMPALLHAEIKAAIGSLDPLAVREDSFWQTETQFA